MAKLPLTILAVISAIGLSTLATHPHSPRPQTADLLWTFEVRLLLGLWVLIDRRARRFSLPFEFEAFVFFAWPIALPYYLYRTRGGRGFLYTAVIFGICVAPEVIASAVEATRRLAS